MIRTAADTPSEGCPGHHPPKNFKIEVLANGISSILRPSRRVIVGHFFNLGGLTEPS